MKKHIKIFSLIIILIIADQLTKLWALADLRGSEGIPVISGVFELQYLENRGAAFGILQDKQILFLLITVAVAVLLTYISIRIPEERKYTPLRICYVLLMAGAFGNLIDRVARGYVVDFFYFKLIDFPVFNVADIYVTVGTFILVFAIKGMANVPELTDGLGKFIVFGIIVSIGMSLGGLTGYAINPARDLGPRLAHAVLPIKGKGDSNFGYGLVVPIIGPIIGAIAAVLLYGAIPW